MRFVVVLGAVILLAAGCSAGEPVPAWIAEQAVGLPAVDEPLPASTRSFLIDAIGEARVVAVGESRHDLREQTLRKGQFVRSLVEDGGVRGLILEESLPHVEALDRTIQPDGPPIEEALSSLAAWYLWDTEEFRGTVEWLREFNGSRPPDDRVRLAGMDITAPARGVRAVLAGLPGASLDEADFRLDLHSPLDWQLTLRGMQELSPDESRSVLEAYEELVRRAEASPSPDRTRLVRLARAARWGQRFFDAAPDFEALGEIREQGMAEAVLDLLDTAFAGKRVVIWDHNLHAARSPFGIVGEEGTFVPMGVLLHEALGDEYLAVGAAFGTGSIAADQPHGPRTFPAPAPETVDGAFVAAGVGPCLVDLRGAAGEVAAWWESPRVWRGQEMETTLVPSEAFDLVFFTPEVTRSRLSPTALARYAARDD